MKRAKCVRILEYAKATKGVELRKATLNHVKLHQTVLKVIKGDGNSKISEYAEAPKDVKLRKTTLSCVKLR